MTDSTVTINEETIDLSWLSERTMPADVLMDAWKRYQKLRHEHPEYFGLKSTGLASLDYILGGGVEFGQYVLIGGAQKSGKSTLLKHIAKAYGEQDVNSVFLSAEMTNMQVATMLVAEATEIDRTRIRSLGLKDDDWEIITFNYGFSTVKDIYDVIESVEYVTQRPVRAIFGDYIHLMESPVGRNRQEQISAISRALKLLSINRQLPIAVFMAAQINREAAKAMIIEMTSFLGSGQLERDMDIGMIIHDLKDEQGDVVPNEKNINVVGSRETGIGECRVSYNGAIAKLSDHVKIVQNQKESYWQP
jgi:replicative DNA helicase